MSTVLLEVVTPDRAVLAHQVNMVIISTGGGELGILPRHAALAATVKRSIVTVRLEGGEDYISVSGGFLEVRPDHITLLASAAQTSITLDVDRAQRARARAEERLATRGETVDVARAEAALARATNRLKMYELSTAAGRVFDRVLNHH